METDFIIYTAPNRFTAKWREESVSWADFAARCTEPKVTRETAAEYAAMSPRDRGAAKDVGAFFGGSLLEGARRTGSVLCRRLVTLDYDHPSCAAPLAGQPVVASLRRLGLRAVAYTTHSHTAAAPRFRVVVMLARPVQPDHYRAVARAIADALGTDGIDSTTFEPERMFYWPSRSADAPFEAVDLSDGRPAEPEKFNIENVKFKIESSACRLQSKNLKFKMEPGDASPNPDPRDKGGLVGAFCRAYSISEAIEAFLPGVYRRAGASRWTYTGGSTEGGLVVYDDLWADSHHDTDPAAGHVVNAYDLVRCHLFGGGAVCTDPAAADRMKDFARRKLKMGNAAPRRPAAEPCFQTYPNSIDGARRAVLDLLGDRVWYDSFSRSVIVKGGLPWRADAFNWQDRDFDCLSWYLESRGIKSEGAVVKGFTAAMTENCRNPVADYILECARTDYTPGELERLFIDYLGADDTPYVRAVTRIFFTAAVARIFDPGCKFDYCPVLQGPQGIGKSTVLAIMGGEWFSDSLTTMEGKDAMEQLRGRWLIELGELSAVRRSDLEAVKSFISRRVDIYRPAYARATESWPRQCVMAATTNQNVYLQGESNRRFLPVAVRGGAPRSVFNDLPGRRDALWAEAYALWSAGTDLYFSAEVEIEALARQNDANVEADNPFMGELEVFLATEVPLGFAEWTPRQRRDYMLSPAPHAYPLRGLRERVCPREFLYERYGLSPDAYNYRRKAAEVAAALRRMGWREVATSSHCIKAYGRQKTYVRPDDSPETTNSSAA